MRYLFVKLLLLIFFFYPCGQQARCEQEIKNDNEDFIIKYKNGFISAEIVNIPLEKVLIEISSKTRIPIITFGELNEKVSVKLEHIPLDKGIEKILGKKTNFLFLYKKDKILKRSVLKSVKIFPKKIQKKSHEGLLLSSHGATSQVNIDTVNSPYFNEQTEAERPKKNADTKEIEIYFLSSSQEEGAKKIILKRLSDPDPWVRESAARALGKIGGQDSLRALLSALNDEAPSVRESAALSLGRIGDKGAVSGLKQLLNDEDEMVRRAAEFSLNQLTKQ